jgi:hypothetical protein
MRISPLSTQIARLRLALQRLHRVVYGSSADHLDPVIVAKFVSDGGFGQKGLRLHQANGRMRELARYSQDRGRVVSGAVSEIWRDRNRAEQNKRAKHGRPAVAVNAVASRRRLASLQGKAIVAYTYVLIRNVAERFFAPVHGWFTERFDTLRSERGHGVA